MSTPEAWLGSPPTLFGHRMRRRMRAHGVTVWVFRFGGISAVISHDPELDRPWHWQLDAWTKNGAISGNVGSQRAAIAAIERLLKKVSNDVWASRFSQESP